MDEQVTQDEAPVEKVASSKSKLWVALGLLVIIVAGIGAYTLSPDYNAVLANNTALQAHLESAENAITTLKKQTANAMQRQQEELSRFQQTLTKMHNQTADKSQDWLREEALYFMRMANYNLMLERNPAMAVKLLKIADETLKQAGNADSLALRQSINDDLATLATIPYIDTETLYLRLNTLAKQLTNLPIKKPETAPAVNLKDENDTWLTHLKKSLSKLSSLIVVRRHDEFTHSMLQPEAVNQLYQTMQLHLSSAQVALLQKQNGIYTQSLEQINNWIETYFDTSDPATRTVMTEIKSLSDINIDPHLPRIDVPDSNKVTQL